MLPIYADLLAEKVKASTLAAMLGEKALAAMVAVVTAPLCFSFVHRPEKADRLEMIALLKKIRVPKPVVQLWLGGLVAAGHPEDVLADLEANKLLDHWDLHAGLALTLTPFAMALLDLELVELGSDPVASRWSIIWPERPQKVRQEFPLRGERVGLLDAVDGRPGPEALAILNERGIKVGQPVIDVWDNHVRVLGQFLYRPKPGSKKAGKHQQRKQVTRAARRKRVLEVDTGRFVVAG
jgi:hypothetical protein